MTFRNFIYGLAATFGVAWIAVVVIPFFKMRNLEPVDLTADPEEGLYFPKRAGRVINGAQVYAENGCYLCHTQVVRPTYAGNDMYRADWGGLKDDEERGDTRRETNAFDFGGEKFAQIGVFRMGPDLSNLGLRVEKIYAKGGSPEEWLYAYLYDPRHSPSRRTSNCPSFRFLFEERKIQGNRSAEALSFGGTDTTELLPGPDAKALVSYLLSLKKDQPAPASLNFARETKDGDS